MDTEKSNSSNTNEMISIIKNNELINIKKSQNKENEIYINKKRLNKGKNNLLTLYIKSIKECFNDKNFSETFVCGLGSCLDLALEISYHASVIIPNIKIGNITSDSISVNDDVIEPVSGNNGIKSNNNRQKSRNLNLIRVQLVKI